MLVLKRLGNGFVILAIYRLSILAVQKLLDEMGSIWGESFSTFIQPLFALVAVGLLGVFVELYFSWLSGAHGRRSP